MNKRLLAIITILALLLFLVPLSQAETTGDLVKCPDFSSVYFLAADGQRYVFPNEKIYFSWYENFDQVVEISCATLASYQIGGNATYQPGTRLVKIPSVPTVYAVESEGVLRAIESEEQARALYGAEWAKRVDDLSEAFFPAYELGEKLADSEVPEGTVLREESTLYRIDENGEAIELTNALSQGYGSVLSKFALTLDDIEGNLGLTIARERAADQAADALDAVIAKLTTVHREAPPVSVTGKYLMSFHACDTATADCASTLNHRVYLAQSDNGEDWSLLADWKPLTGSVPDVIRHEDTLYIFTASDEVIRYHPDTGRQESPEKVTVTGLTEGFVDPSLYVDDDGRLVLFFLYGQIGSDPARCPTGQSSCTKRFGSATEVAGSDGREFTLDSGDRAQVTISTTGNVITASDPDIFYDGTRYILYISYGQTIAVWTSTSLRGTYTQLNSQLSSGSAGIPSGYFDATTGRYWTYGHGRPLTAPTGPSVIRRATSSALSSTLSENDWSTAASGASLGFSSSTNVESPGFAVNEQ